MKIHFTGQTDGMMEGIRVLAGELDMELSEEGFSVSAELSPSYAQSLSITVQEGKAEIRAKDKPAFFRAIGLLRPHIAEKQWEYTETRCFDRNGIMFDCSRNAVLKLEHLRYLLRKMALMGHSWAMLYTEDTYELESEPYFGYCRGRYSQKELKELDDYADALGIELVPCIQTLSHLDRFLHWNAGEKYKDTDSTLMVGNEAAYDLIERMVVAASQPFRSKRIHIGMDEAWDLGLGKLIKERGYTSPTVLMAEHLRRVRGIIEKHGLHAMMWSDMHFENAGPGGYFADDKQFTREIIDSAPADMDLVYWNYYHEDERGYDRMLSQLELFSARKIFAGGIWTWSGIAPDYRKTFTVTRAGLSQSSAHGIREVFATAWGDNGGECPATATLLGLQLYAEYDYAHTFDWEWLSRRFRECVGADAESFLCLSELHYPCELPKEELGVINACKVLLYEDPLMPLHEKDFEGELHAYYEKLERIIEKNAASAPDELRPMMEFFAALSTALRLKCLWRERAAAAVRGGDRQEAGQLVFLAEENLHSLEMLDECWYRMWMHTNKPFGYEVVDGRLGWLQARFKTAGKRMNQFARGQIDDIPELSEEKLPCLMESGTYLNDFRWAPFVSTGLV